MFLTLKCIEISFFAIEVIPIPYNIIIWLKFICWLFSFKFELKISLLNYFGNKFNLNPLSNICDWIIEKESLINSLHFFQTDIFNLSNRFISNCNSNVKSNLLFLINSSIFLKCFLLNYSEKNKFH